jgi:hypothetical protein
MWQNYTWDRARPGDLIKVVRMSHRVADEGWPSGMFIRRRGEMVPIDIYVFLGSPDAGSVDLLGPTGAQSILTRRVQFVGVASNINIDVNP